MITLNAFGKGKRYERSGYQVVCSFHVFLRKSSEENSTDVLTSSGTFIDFFKKIEANCITSPYDDLRFFRLAVINKRSRIFDKNDRLSYIDNDNDEIPIDQQSEFLEALKFAQEYCKDNDKKIPLIITKAKDKSVKSPQKAKKTESSNNSSDKMPPMRVESTPLQDLLTSDTPEGAAAVNEFQDFLENYKKQIVSEVTEQVLKKMTSAMLLSQNMDAVENQFPRPSQLFPQKIQKKSKKSKKFTDAELQDSGKVPNHPKQFKIRTGNFMQTLIKPQFDRKIQLDDSKKLLSGSKPVKSQNLEEGPSVECIIEEGLQTKGKSYEKNIAETSENTVIGPRQEKRSRYPDPYVPYLEEAQEILKAGISNRHFYDKREMNEAMIRSFEQQAVRNNLSSEAEKAGSSRKSGNNDDNQDVNEKQSPSDSDNISILSDCSHMSDFMTGYDDNEDKLVIDCNKTLLRPENQSDESLQSEEVEEPRHDSSSSFELVCESPSWIEDKEQLFFLGKQPQKSMKDSFLIEPDIINAVPKDNMTSSAFDSDTREKSYEKNIAETSEDTVIAPQLEKRSGGAYSYVPHILEETRENVFDFSSSKSAKSADKKFKIFSSDEEPQGVVFFGKKKTAEQQKSSEDRDTLQPRRRVVFDHNTAKGLGDTKQTSPKKRGVNKSGESRRPTFFGPGSGFQHQYGCVPPPRYFYPPQFSDGTNGNHENWSYFYGGQVPPQMNQPQWPPGYPPYPDTMHILPETLISGAVQAASSAYTTARKVIEKIRSPPPDSPRGPQPPKM